MEPRPTTIVVESRLLVREALKSLMEENSYRVVCEVGSISGIGLQTVGCDEPKLVILSAQSADTALIEAVSARRLWPDSKIVLLYEYASPADFQKLLNSDINGCVSWSVSLETLISTLALIVTTDRRVMVGANANDPVIQLVPPGEPHPSEIKHQSDGAEHDDISVSIDAAKSPTIGADASIQQRLPALRRYPGLTEREVQILHGLVQGHSNRMIARTCDITKEAVKTHVRSILRKIGVKNRTQAAIWAKENGYGG
jgi:two-component system, NarL family, nitrate/nitrite response regulator NarL